MLYIERGGGLLIANNGQEVSLKYTNAYSSFKWNVTKEDNFIDEHGKHMVC